MKDFRVGYLYSLAPIHCGGEGDLGNILEIARETHTRFPYIPGSSWRGTVRNDVLDTAGQEAADRLFGKELDSNSQMGVHQAWFGDARLLWMPMRTMSSQGQNVFAWVSCHSLLRDHALLSGQVPAEFSEVPVGDCPGEYLIADAELEVAPISGTQRPTLSLSGSWPTNLRGSNSTQGIWSKSRIVLSDADFQILMEHSLWTQIRNKIQKSAKSDEQAGGAEVFWTDVCIPRDTILYYPWGYNIDRNNPATEPDHVSLKGVLESLLQVGGQANVGRGWVQSWIANENYPDSEAQQLESLESSEQSANLAVTTGVGA